MYTPPAPPALRPQNPHGQMSSRTVLAIVEMILRGRSFRTAAMSSHVSHDFGEWERRASTSDDPFWPWAVAAVRGAEAAALGEVEEAHRGVALRGQLPDGNDATPSAVRAQENALKAARGSDLYTDPSNQAALSGGGVGVTIANLLVFLGQGQGSNVGALVDRAFAPAAIEAPVLDARDIAAPAPRAAAKVSFKRGAAR